jgi:long-chain acyl-CoA synthetase
VGADPYAGLPGLTLAARIEAAARRVPERPALLWDGGVLTHAALAARVAALAGHLAAAGRGPGDRIAVTLPNGWELVVALLAALRLGATVAPLDHFLRPDERAAILADLRPALVLEARDVAAGCEAAAPRAPAPPAEPRAPALVLYTSGSTGRPKGAVISADALAFACRSWSEDILALTPDDRVLAALPLAHAYGLAGALLAPLAAGAATVLVERFAPEPVAGLLAAGRATVFPGVATMFRRILDVPGFAPAPRLPALRLALSGAAPCPWPLAQEWRARTGVRLARGYGMTELFRPISYLAGDGEDRPESIGRAVPGVTVRVVDDADRTLGPGEVGELLIRTPAALDGYLDAPDETAAVLRDGWFRTGDLACLSADGYVTIAGRRRERILRGGYSVFPQEVEAVLLAHGAVAEAAVVGVPDPELGEEVAAFVTLRPGAAAAAETLIAHCRERLAGFKYPRRVTIVPSLPRNATGKVVKSRLC